MLLVNPQQLREEAENLSASAATLQRACDTIEGVLAALGNQRPLDAAKVRLMIALRKLSVHHFSLQQMGRALEQIGSTYAGYERRIENNCNSTIVKVRANAMAIHAVTIIGHLLK